MEPKPTYQTAMQAEIDKLNALAVEAAKMAVRPQGSHMDYLNERIAALEIALEETRGQLYRANETIYQLQSHIRDLEE